MVAGWECNTQPQLQLPLGWSARTTRKHTLPRRGPARGFGLHAFNGCNCADRGVELRGVGPKKTLVTLVCVVGGGGVNEELLCV